MQGMKSSLLPLTVLLVLACASGPGSRGAPTDRMLVTREQVERMNVPDAFEVVRRTRPEFLRERMQSTRTSVYAVVYVNGVRSGGPGILRNVRSAEIEQIHFVSAIDATTRYGTDHGGGVIEVTIRQGVRR